MSDTIKSRGRTIHKSSIEQLALKELVAMYNDAAEDLDMKPVKKFSDRKSAVRRTWEIMEKWAAQDETTGRKPRGMRFVFPVTDDVKPVRAGTSRAKLVELLSREGGASFDECMNTVWGDRRDLSPEKKIKATYEGIRLLHYFSGYGLKQDENGNIHLVTA